MYNETEPELNASVQGTRYEHEQLHYEDMDTYIAGGNDEEIPDASEWSVHDEHGLCKPTAIFAAQLRASRSMTLLNADMVLHSSTNMVRGIVQHLQKLTLTKLKSVAENRENLNNALDDARDQSVLHEDPFLGISSQYMENKYFLRDGPLIMPQEKVLGYRVEEKNNRMSGYTTQVVGYDTMSYIPMRCVLKKFFKLPGVWEAVQQNKSKDDGILRDFHDGLYFKKMLYSLSPTLDLYNDDKETANPLGTHTGIHKLGFFYYIVKELPATYNSLLANCHLLHILYAANRKEFGFSKILESIVDELKHLNKEGMHVCINDTQVHISVALGQVSGDNLGMQALFGFT